jgi:hypothetical protein
MLKWINQGWKTTRSQTLVIVLLFLYQWIWGFVLYKFINSIIGPLMHRYPGAELPAGSVQLYLAEGQFQLLKTDLVYPYLWLLLAVAATRMLLTPVLYAGMYFSLHRTDLNAGYRFVQGVKQLFKPFFMYYLAQTALMLLPLYWIWPKIAEVLKTSGVLTSAAVQLLPYIGGMLVYGYLLHLIFMFIQFARMTETKWTQTGGLLLRHFFVIIGLSLTVLAMAGIAFLLTYGSSLYWAGLTAIILHQLYYVVRTVFRIWGTAAQYHLWMAKADA